jgi:threonine dehydrogenase-like Zn-dependent dehydrogenase
MRAVVCQHGALDVRDLPAPVPGPGQLILDVQRCGICGSDLHARRHGDEMADVLAEIGYPDFGRVDQPVVFGHEFVGTVAERGPATRGTLPVGTPVVAIPLVRRGRQVHAVGLSQQSPGAYAEQVLVQESMTLRISNGLGPDTAALTEPMAIAWHAVARSEVRTRDIAIVIGCGPVGLSVICLLKARGISTSPATFRRAVGRWRRTAAPTWWSTRPRTRRTPRPPSTSTW